MTEVTVPARGHPGDGETWPRQNPTIGQLSYAHAQAHTYICIGMYNTYICIYIDVYVATHISAR